MDMSVVDAAFVVSSLGLLAAALSSLVAIWMERDASKPARWALALSILVLLTQSVAIHELYSNARESAALQEDMARILEALDEMSAGSPDGELGAFVQDEMRSQMRSNPKVVERMAERYKSRGKDPAKELGRHIDPVDLEKVEVKGAGKDEGDEKGKGKDKEHGASGEHGK